MQIGWVESIGWFSGLFNDFDGHHLVINIFGSDRNQLGMELISEYFPEAHLFVDGLDGRRLNDLQKGVSEGIRG